MTDYAFGDSELAADRLARLARLFAPAMESVLDQVPITPKHVVDLGCGPGHTTRMLAQRWPSAMVTGFDVSGAYVDRARARGIDAMHADVTQPLRDGHPYDLAFARYEAITRGLVQSRGAPLYAGPSIARIEPPTGFERIADRVIDIDLTAGEAASLFWRNIPNWAEQAVDEGLASRDELEALGERLRAREGDDQRGCFEWRQRQTIIAASEVASVEVA